MNDPGIHKVVWLFSRQEGADRPHFFEHYLTVHAPLAVRCHRAMRGYAVNLADVSDDPAQRLVGGVEVDAMPVLWHEVGAPIFDSDADRDALMADHDSFLGPSHSYRVHREHLIVPRVDEFVPGPASPGVKVMLFALDAGGSGSCAPPPLPPGRDVDVLEWVENTDLEPADRSSPPLLAMHEIRLRAAAQAEHLATEAADQGWVPVPVTEYPQLPRPDAPAE